MHSFTEFAFVFSACDSKDAGNKQLVLYYSQTGSSKVVAEEIQKMLDADIELIELENPYTGTYAETLEKYNGDYDWEYENENKLHILAVKPCIGIHKL